MRRLFIISMLLIGLRVEARNTSDAVGYALKAATKTEPVKKVFKKAENILTSIVPVERETVATIGSTAIMLTSGKIETKHIKNLNIKIPGGNLRPDVIYKFKEGYIEAYLDFRWKW